jgi:hypothetical protein
MGKGGIFAQATPQGECVMCGIAPSGTLATAKLWLIKGLPLFNRLMASNEQALNFHVRTFSSVRCATICYVFSLL